MRKMFLLPYILLTAVLVFGISNPCIAKTTVLRFGTALPPSPNAASVHYQELSKRINNRTNGDYDIKYFPAETLIKAPEALRAVGSGVAEMTLIVPGIYAGMEPRFIHLPMFFNNVKANAAACELLLEPFNEILEKKFNQKAISCFTTGALELIGRKPVKTLGDWKGLLVQALDPSSSALATNLGASPVVISWTEGYSALEKGVIDNILFGTVGMVELRLTDVSKYVTIFYGLPVYNLITVNLDVWKKMPQQVRDIFIEEGEWSTKDQNQYFIDQADKDIDDLKKVGMDIYFVPKEERDKWYDAQRPFNDAQLKKMGDFGQKLEQIAEQVNKQYPLYGK